MTTKAAKYLPKEQIGRYLVFAGDDWYPVGGQDLLMITDNYEESFLKHIEKDENSNLITLKEEGQQFITNKDWENNHHYSDYTFEWYQVFDLVTNEFIMDVDNGRYRN